MKISKVARKWLEGLKDTLQMEKSVQVKLEERADELRKKWRDAENDPSRDDGEKYWKLLRDAENDLRILQSSIDYHEKYVAVLYGTPLYANEVMYSDVNPYEVIEIKTNKTMVVRAMKAEIKADAKARLQRSFSPGGFVGHFDNDEQEWDITPDEKGKIRTIRFHNSKSSRGWYDKTQRFTIATKPCKFYDYNF